MKKTAILLLLTVSFNLLAQSPWVQKKSKGYTQLSYTSISNYNTLFGEPQIDLSNEISDNTLQFYGEYGLSEKTSLLVNLPFKLTTSKGVISTSNNSLGNIQIGVKHNFYKKKWLLSGQLAVEANTGTYDKISGLRTGYDAWSFTPLFLAGRGFDKWYIQAFTGFDIRTNKYSSNYKLGGEIGYKTFDWLWIACFLDGVASLNNGNIVVPTQNLNTGLYINNQSYSGFGLKFIGEINDKFGTNLALGGAFSGYNVAKVPAISFGFYYKL
ncbi:transporter [Tenacibaculum salmonis]|uniref:transporter n=1 Tax=Tenacibaculum sp. P3-BQ1 TaxID=3232310 RepID=UPI0034DEB003